jgi:D-serine deaminase-like pyridoxal phosphate-dependent protein
MTEPRWLEEIPTPAAVVDLERMRANLQRMAEYTAVHGVALRPHTKTHKAPELAAEQLRRGAVGVTVANVREAEVMAAVADDIFLAYPPVGSGKLDRLLSLPEHVRLTVALDSIEALDALSHAAVTAGRPVGVLVELDVGMHRVGIGDPDAAVALARAASERPGVSYVGITFYPGHIREPVDQQAEAIARLSDELSHFLHALREAGLEPEVVSGGSTPAAFSTHRLDTVTEIRPGTYIFNDRTTASIGACAWEDCAYTVLATVVSTAVSGQAVVDAGSKALSREELRAPDAAGFGALLEWPEVVVKGLSEEHGLLDLSRTSWRPRIGDRVRIVPNHVCVSVNLFSRVHGVEGAEVRQTWEVRARGW